MGDSQLSTIRHSCSHILASAILKLYPGTKLGIGPSIENGFYYDFELPRPISEDDLPKISETMAQIIDQKIPFERDELTIEKAKMFFKDQPYKLDLIDELAREGEKKVSLYKSGEFIDLCAGPHVENTEKIGAFKLLSLAGAYWRGSEKNQMLTRIYGTSFPNQKELDAYLKLLEESQKRDHRKLGKELDFFSVSPLTGPGLILWHPKLSISRIVAENFWREAHQKHNYKFVFTPHIASMDMFVMSRHYLKYIDSMFPVMLHQNIEGESSADFTTDEQLKPMNCPNHIQIYKVRPRSYRELPIRLAELSTVYRYERAGALHGMTRVRGFTQDDTHIFCTPEQVVDEVRGVIQLTKYIYEVYGFKNYQAYLSTRPPKYLGTEKMWETAENNLKKALEAEGIDFKIDEGQGVFYGPKIDSKVKDSLGREWQLGTIQVDFNMPTRAETTEEDIEGFWKMKTFKDKFKTKEALAKYLKKLGRGFNVTFINDQGKEEQAVMIHRTIYGSMERFFGILIEHYGGAFPTWLAPVQIAVLPISDKHRDYAVKITDELKNRGIRAELNAENQTISAKIREAELQKVPYMAIVGDREVTAGNLAIRGRGEKDLGPMTKIAFLDKLQSEIENKSVI